MAATRSGQAELQRKQGQREPLFVLCLAPSLHCILITHLRLKMEAQRGRGTGLGAQTQEAAEQGHEKVLNQPTAGAAPSPEDILPITEEKAPGPLKCRLLQTRVQLTGFSLAGRLQWKPFTVCREGNQQGPPLPACQPLCRTVLPSGLCLTLQTLIP